MEYANTLNDLGTAYGHLAEVEYDEKNLHKAIDTFQEALEIVTIENDPAYYSRCKHNLGRTYRSLAKAEDTEKNLKKAISTFHDALEVRTIERYPIEYATT